MTNESLVRARVAIERMLAAQGCDSVIYGRRGRKEWFVFEAHGGRFMFRLEMPDPDDTRFTRTPSQGRMRTEDAARRLWEAEQDRAWRALESSIGGKLKAIDAGISSWHKEFLAFMVLPGEGNQTAGEYMAYLLAEDFAGKELPALMPGESAS